MLRLKLGVIFKGCIKLIKRCRQINRGGSAALFIEPKQLGVVIGKRILIHRSIFRFDGLSQANELIDLYME